MRLSILEPHCSGHRSAYVRWLAIAARERGWEVSVGTAPACLRHPGLRELAEKEIPLVGLAAFSRCPIQSAFGLPGREVGYFYAFAAAWRESGGAADAVLVPGLDHFLYAGALLGSPFGKKPWIGVSLRPAFHLYPLGVTAPAPGLRQAIQRQLFSRLLKSVPGLQAVVTTDPLLGDFVHADSRGGSGRLVYAPEPAGLAQLPDREAARRQFDLPQDALVLLVFGALSPRKGIAELLRATDSPGWPAELHLLLVGKQDAEIRALLASESAAALRQAGKLHMHDEFVPTTTEAVAFAAADLAWLGYRDHFTMSGLWVQAASAGLPIVACRAGLIGRLTEQTGSGVLVDPQDTRSVAAELARLCADETLRGRFGRNGRIAAADHTPAVFCERILDTLLTQP
ncbi:MAG: glycosyltransferase [Gammaproteobacteria bacterium]|nr:glycosyltransferase [Gammaproteobacteria bacterium]